MDSIEKNKQYKENKKLEKSKTKTKEKIVKARTKKPIVSKSKPITRKTKTKVVKKKTSTKLRKSKLLKRAKQVVYARDKNICQHCWVSCSWSNRHASHVIPVSATWRLALYPLNMKVMCYHCHMNWWHKNPIEASERFKWKFPERIDELKRLQLSLPMWTITPTELDVIENMINEFEVLYWLA